MPQTTDDRVAVGVAELARRLSISKATAYDWVRAGHVPSIRIKGRILIPVRSLEDAISTGCRPTCTCVCHHEGAA
jgi:excisionase family DNA binding protein